MPDAGAEAMLQHAQADVAAGEALAKQALAREEATIGAPEPELLHSLQLPSTPMAESKTPSAPQGATKMPDPAAAGSPTEVRLQQARADVAAAKEAAAKEAAAKEATLAASGSTAELPIDGRAVTSTFLRRFLDEILPQECARTLQDLDFACEEHRQATIDAMEAAGPAIKMYHVKDALVRFLTRHNKGRFCDLPEYRRHFGPATHFVSHAWADAFCDLVAQLCEHTARELARGNPEPRYWIDVFAICQWKGALQRADMPQGLNNTDHGFRRVIASTGKVVLALHRCLAPHMLGRAWCLYEMWASVRGGAKLEALMTEASREELRAALGGGGLDVVGKITR